MTKDFYRHLYKLWVLLSCWLGVLATGLATQQSKFSSQEEVVLPAEFWDIHATLSTYNDHGEDSFKTEYKRKGPDSLEQTIKYRFYYFENKKDELYEQHQSFLLWAYLTIRMDQATNYKHHLWETFYNIKEIKEWKKNHFSIGMFETVAERALSNQYYLFHPAFFEEAGRSTNETKVTKEPFFTIEDIFNILCETEYKELRYILTRMLKEKAKNKEGKAFLLNFIQKWSNAQLKNKKEGTINLLMLHNIAYMLLKEWFSSEELLADGREILDTYLKNGEYNSVNVQIRYYLNQNERAYPMKKAWKKYFLDCIIKAKRERIEEGTEWFRHLLICTRFDSFFPSYIKNLEVALKPLFQQMVLDCTKIKDESKEEMRWPSYAIKLVKLLTWDFAKQLGRTFPYTYLLALAETPCPRNLYWLLQLVNKKNWKALFTLEQLCSFKKKQVSSSIQLIPVAKMYWLLYNKAYRLDPISQWQGQDLLSFENKTDKKEVKQLLEQLLETTPDTLFSYTYQRKEAYSNLFSHLLHKCNQEDVTADFLFKKEEKFSEDKMDIIAPIWLDRLSSNGISDKTASLFVNKLVTCPALIQEVFIFSMKQRLELDEKIKWTTLFISIDQSLRFDFSLLCIQDEESEKTIYNEMLKHFLDFIKDKQQEHDSNEEYINKTNILKQRWLDQIVIDLSNQEKKITLKKESGQQWMKSIAFKVGYTNMVLDTFFIQLYDIQACQDAFIRAFTWEKGAFFKKIKKKYNVLKNKAVLRKSVVEPFDPEKELPIKEVKLLDRMFTKDKLKTIGQTWYDRLKENQLLPELFAPLLLSIDNDVFESILSRFDKRDCFKDVDFSHVLWDKEGFFTPSIAIFTALYCFSSELFERATQKIRINEVPNKALYFSLGEELHRKKLYSKKVSSPPLNSNDRGMWKVKDLHSSFLREEEWEKVKKTFECWLFLNREKDISSFYEQENRKLVEQFPGFLTSCLYVENKKLQKKVSELFWESWKTLSDEQTHSKSNSNQTQKEIYLLFLMHVRKGRDMLREKFNSKIKQELSDLLSGASWMQGIIREKNPFELFQCVCKEAFKQKSCPLSDLLWKKWEDANMFPRYEYEVVPERLGRFYKWLLQQAVQENQNKAKEKLIWLLRANGEQEHLIFHGRNRILKLTYKKEEKYPAQQDILLHHSYTKESAKARFLSEIILDDNENQYLSKVLEKADPELVQDLLCLFFSYWNYPIIQKALKFLFLPPNKKKIFILIRNTSWTFPFPYFFLSSFLEKTYDKTIFEPHEEWTAFEKVIKEKIFALTKEQKTKWLQDFFSHLDHSSFPSKDIAQRKKSKEGIEESPLIKSCEIPKQFIDMILDYAIGPFYDIQEAFDLLNELIHIEKEEWQQQKEKGDKTIEAQVKTINEKIIELKKILINTTIKEQVEQLEKAINEEDWNQSDELSNRIAKKIKKDKKPYILIDRIRQHLKSWKKAKEVRDQQERSLITEGFAASITFDMLFAVKKKKKPLENGEKEDKPLLLTFELFLKVCRTTQENNLQAIFFHHLEKKGDQKESSEDTQARLGIIATWFKVVSTLQAQEQKAYDKVLPQILKIVLSYGTVVACSLWEEIEKNYATYLLEHLVPEYLSEEQAKEKDRVLFNLSYLLPIAQVLGANNKEPKKRLGGQDKKRQKWKKFFQKEENRAYGVEVNKKEFFPFFYWKINKTPIIDVLNSLLSNNKTQPTGLFPLPYLEKKGLKRDLEKEDPNHSNSTLYTAMYKAWKKYKTLTFFIKNLEKTQCYDRTFKYYTPFFDWLFDPQKEDEWNLLGDEETLSWRKMPPHCLKLLKKKWSKEVIKNPQKRYEGLAQIFARCRVVRNVSTYQARKADVSKVILASIPLEEEASKQFLEWLIAGKQCSELRQKPLIIIPDDYKEVVFNQKNKKKEKPPVFSSHFEKRSSHQGNTFSRSELKPKETALSSQKAASASPSSSFFLIGMLVSGIIVYLLWSRNKQHRVKQYKKRKKRE